MSNLKSLIVTVAVAALVSILAATAFVHTHMPKPVPQTPATALGSGGSVNTNIDIYANGVGIGKEGWVDQFGQLVINAGQNDSAWQNKTGRTVFAKYAQLSTSGTASSSVRFFVLATSTATIPAGQAFTTVVANTALIQGQIIGTSTVATTTNSIKWAANGAMGVVRVDPGSYLHAYAQQVDSVGCSNILACETATSTNRGWGTATTLFEYVYKP